MHRKQVEDVLDSFGLLNGNHVHKCGLWTTQEELDWSDPRQLIIVEMPTYTALVLENHLSRHLKNMTVDHCTKEDILEFVRGCHFPGFDKIYRNKQLRELGI